MKAWKATVLPPQDIGAFRFARLIWDEPSPPVQPGQFVLVRALPTWDPYLRPVFVCIWQDTEAAWWVYPSRVTGLNPVTALAPGTECLVWGPLGQGVPDVPAAAHVVVLVGERHVPFVLGLIRSFARQADVVTLLVRAGEKPYLPSDWSWLPPSVEAISVPEDAGAIQEALAALALWADYVFACGHHEWPELVRQVWHARRSALPPQRVFAVMPEGFICGLGLCDACRLITPRGEVRLCRQGPVLDVSRWWGT